MVLIVGYFYAIILFWLTWQCGINGHKCDLLSIDQTEDVLYMYCIRPSSHKPTPTSRPSHVIQCRKFASPSCESSTPLGTQLSVDPTQAEESPTASSHVQHVTIIALDNPIPPLLLKFFAAQGTKRPFVSFQMAFKHTKVYIKVVKCDINIKIYF
jgi:hypothetical protein